MRYVIIMTMLALVLTGCRAVRTEVATEVQTREVVRMLHDSTFVRDSVFVDRWRDGETVFVDRSTVRYKYINRVCRDTLVVRDSVPYPVEVTRYKYKHDYTAWLFVGVLMLALWASVRCKK